MKKSAKKKDNLVHLQVTAIPFFFKPGARVVATAFDEKRLVGRLRKTYLRVKRAGQAGLAVDRLNRHEKWNGRQMCWLRILKVKSAAPKPRVRKPSKAAAHKEKPVAQGLGNQTVSGAF